jgi:hypothetical protein
VSVELQHCHCTATAAGKTASHPPTVHAEDDSVGKAATCESRNRQSGQEKDHHRRKTKHRSTPRGRFFYLRVATPRIPGARPHTYRRATSNQRRTNCSRRSKSPCNSQKAANACKAAVATAAESTRSPLQATWHQPRHDVSTRIRVLMYINWRYNLGSVRINDQLRQ